MMMLNDPLEQGLDQFEAAQRFISPRFVFKAQKIVCLGAELVISNIGKSLGQCLKMRPRQVHDFNIPIGSHDQRGHAAKIFRLAPVCLMQHLFNSHNACFMHGTIDAPTHILARSGNLLGNNVGLAWKRRAHKHHAVDDIWLSSLDGGGEDG